MAYHKSFKIILSITFLFLAVLGLHCCVGFSLVAECAGYCGAWASHCGGFCCGARAIDVWASVVTAPRL